MTREEQVQKWADDLVARRITVESIPPGRDRDAVQVELINRSLAWREAQADKRKGRKP